MRGRRRIEYGDFQTPPNLAKRVLAVLFSRGVRPISVVEPTCGEGVFLLAAARVFPDILYALGVEIDETYFNRLSASIQGEKLRVPIELRRADFFEVDWAATFGSLRDSVLVVGNPPWVTSADLGALQSSNLPVKSNFQGHKGLDAVTGKANFDIAEWMLIRLLDALNRRPATLAMLVKTSVARRILRHIWKNRLACSGAAIYEFDAQRYFGAAVQACLLVCDLAPDNRMTACQVYDLDNPNVETSTLGLQDGLIISDMAAFEQSRALLADAQSSPRYRWRSGIKHDCTKIMEFSLAGQGLRNGFGEIVDLEDALFFPMLKGSQIGNGKLDLGERYMLVTQREIGQDTSRIRHVAPRTWDYLLRHADRLDARGSSIYRGRPRFSVFGVGPYTFAPWKVAICGLYKKLAFRVVGPVNEKPVVFDDTCYYLSCQNEEEAQFLLDLLTSTAATAFLHAVVFWDAKRPITIETLQRLDLQKLASSLGLTEAWNNLCSSGGNRVTETTGLLF